MSLGTVPCKKCTQNSVRNIHNKCVYCGEAFEQTFHVTEAERLERLDQIEATNEQLKNQIKKDKEREKQRVKDARSRAYKTMIINNDGFS